MPERPPDTATPPTLQPTNIHGSGKVSGMLMCDKCGYALTGLTTDGKCPECATSCTSPDIRTSQKVPAGFLCYKCSYPLTGLDADSTCPECSTPYSLALAFRGKPHPGQASLATRIIWPVALGLFTLVAALILNLGRNTGRDLAGMLGCTSALCAVINLINILVVSGTLSSRYVPPHRRRNWMHNMFFLGQWVGVAWVMAVLVALFCIAAPFIMIAIAMYPW